MKLQVNHTKILDETILIAFTLLEECMYFARAAESLHTGNPLPEEIAEDHPVLTDPKNALLYAMARFKQAEAYMLTINMMPNPILDNEKNETILKEIVGMRDAANEMLQEKYEKVIKDNHVNDVDVDSIMASIGGSA